MSNKKSTLITVVLSLVIITVGLCLSPILSSTNQSFGQTKQIPQKVDTTYLLKTDDPLSFYPMNIYKEEKAISLTDSQKNMLKKKQVVDFLLGLLTLNNSYAVVPSADRDYLLESLLYSFKYFKDSADSKGFFVFVQKGVNFKSEMECALSENGDIIYFKSSRNTITGQSQVIPTITREPPGISTNSGGYYLWKYIYESTSYPIIPNSGEYLELISLLCEGGKKQPLLYAQINKTNLLGKPEQITTTNESLFVYNLDNGSLVVFANDTNDTNNTKIEFCGFTIQFNNNN